MPVSRHSPRMHPGWCLDPKPGPVAGAGLSTRSNGSRAMRNVTSTVVALVLAGITASAAPEAPQPLADDFTSDLSRWSVEQESGGTVRCVDGTLEIESAGGSTVWWRGLLRAPVEIRYEAEVVVSGGPRDRLSDLNCFWMAQDPLRPAGEMPATRSGKFSDYDSLLTYYVGIGGNENTTTRFRRYDGTSARPLRPEHDLRDSWHLLRANHRYQIRIVVREDETEFWRDGERLFVFRDPTPLTSGFFAFRTVRSHLKLSRFQVQPLGAVHRP